MKLTEIMILRNDVDGKTRLKKFLVDNNVLARLIKIRGNFYQDDPKLRPMSELPTMIREPQQTAEPVYSPEAIAATEKAFALYKLMQESKVTTLPHVIESEPKPMTFDEQLEHDWRFNPGICKEFISFASYAAL